VLIVGWIYFLAKFQMYGVRYGDYNVGMLVTMSHICYCCGEDKKVLWHLLDQLVKMPGAAKMAPPLQWRQDVERYCNNIPAYYVLPLRQALKRWGLNAHVVPDSMENSLLAGFVGTQLKKLKAEARVIFDADMSRIMV
jgi:hypothetical protein